MERMEQALILLYWKLRSAPSFTHQAVAEVKALIRERRFIEARAAFLRNGLQSAVNSVIGTMEGPGVERAYKDFENAYHAALQYHGLRDAFTAALDQVRPPPDRSASQPNPVQTLEETGGNSPSSQRRPIPQPRSRGPISDNPTQQPLQTESLQRGKPDRTRHDIETTRSRQELQLENLIQQLRLEVTSRQSTATYAEGAAFFNDIARKINHGGYIAAVISIHEKMRINSQVAANTILMQELENMLLSLNQKKIAIMNEGESDPAKIVKQFRLTEYFNETGGVDDRGDDPISDNPTRQPSQTTSLQRGKPDRSWDDIETTPSRLEFQLENLLQKLRFNVVSNSQSAATHAEEVAFYNHITRYINHGNYIEAIVSIQRERRSNSQLATNTIFMNTMTMQRLENTLLSLNQKRNAIMNEGESDPDKILRQYRLTEYLNEAGGVDDRGDSDPDADKPFRNLYVSDPEKKTQRSEAGNDIDFVMRVPAKKTQRSEAGNDIDFVQITSDQAKKQRQSEAGGVPVSRMLDPEKKKRQSEAGPDENDDIPLTEVKKAKPADTCDECDDSSDVIAVALCERCHIFLCKIHASSHPRARRTLNHVVAYFPN